MANARPERNSGCGGGRHRQAGQRNQLAQTKQQLGESRGTTASGPISRLALEKRPGQERKKKRRLASLSDDGIWWLGWTIKTKAGRAGPKFRPAFPPLFPSPTTNFPPSPQQLNSIAFPPFYFSTIPVASPTIHTNCATRYSQYDYLAFQAEEGRPSGPRRSRWRLVRTALHMRFSVASSPAKLI